MSFSYWSLIVWTTVNHPKVGLRVRCEEEDFVYLTVEYVDMEVNRSLYGALISEKK